MGLAIGSKAISHLEEISEHEISLMAQSETVGILLPATAYNLRLKQPPARKLIDSGCIVALGSDFSPNSFCYSMVLDFKVLNLFLIKLILKPLVMHLACINMQMSLNEALIASTINSAFSLGCEDKRGSIEVNKQADLIIIQANRF